MNAFVSSLTFRSRNQLDLFQLKHEMRACKGYQKPNAHSVTELSTQRDGLKSDFSIFVPRLITTLSLKTKGSEERKLKCAPCARSIEDGIAPLQDLYSNLLTSPRKQLPIDAEYLLKQGLPDFSPY